ncbi:MAG: hypothetical protein LBR94_00685 [Desulfovibrio sp.]|jgi:hypothetical protein|nr:hypothetical protein [Desulfovibrio sp.]
MIPFECKKLENCFASSAVYQYRSEKKVDEIFLNWLEPVSDSFLCRRDFPRPFFTAVLVDGTQIKGVIGDTAIKVIYPNGTAAESKEAFEKLLKTR